MVRRLLVLNGLCVLAVVLYHSSGWGFTSMFWWTDRYSPVATPNFDQMGSLAYYGLRAVEQAVIFGIPGFLFVSGYFIAVATGRNQSTIGWTVILTRIKKLAIPFLFWSVLILMADIVLLGARFTPKEFLLTIITGQTRPPYYYVPVLAQLLVLSVLLVPLAKHRWKLLLLVAALVHILVLSWEYVLILEPDSPILKLLLPLGAWAFFPKFVFWFSFGIVVGFHLPQFKRALSRVKWALPGALAITFVLGMVEWEVLLRLSGQDWLAPRETIIDHLYAGAFLLTFFAFEGSTPVFSKRLSKLGESSYGVYLIHAPVLTYSAKIIYHLLPWLLAYQILLQPLLIVVGLGVPLLLMAIVNRSRARNYYAYLFG